MESEKTYEDSDDEEELKGPSGSFERLDSLLHYSLTQNGTEIIPTDYVLSNQKLSKPMETYGAPASSISTFHVIGRKINKKHHQYHLSAGMILGVREVVGGVRSLYDEESDENDEGEEDDDDDDDDEEKSEEDDDTEIDEGYIDPDDEDDEDEGTEDEHSDKKPMTKLEADKDNNYRDSISPSPARINMNRLREQCNHFEKYKFPAGSYIISGTKALPYRYKFKAYAPRVFSKIRNFFGVGKQEFLHSICGKGAFIEFMSNAKSGQVSIYVLLYVTWKFLAIINLIRLCPVYFIQFFFYSHDGRYMIKTQTKAESTMLRSILPGYVNYMFENPHSFLTHFYGLYRVMMPDLGHKIHFVIMKSVFNTEKEIHKIYDLKGSTVGRRAKRGDSVHKDLDILDEGWKIRVGQPVKKAMMSQLRRDTDFLVRLRIMDYSLLLGLHVHSSDSDHVQQEDPTIDPSSPVKVYRSEILRSNTPLTRKLSQFDDSMDSGLSLCLESDESSEKDENKVRDDLSNPSDETHNPIDESGLRDLRSTDASFPFDESNNETISPQSYIHMMNSFSSTELLVAGQIQEYTVESDINTVTTESRRTAGEPDNQKVFDSVKSYQSWQGNPFTSREDCGIPSYHADGKSASREIYFIGKFWVKL